MPLAPPPDWSRKLRDPIPVQSGKPLVILRDAATYITSLPKGEQDAAAWQTATEMLLLVAEHGGDTMMPRIAVLQALNHGLPDPKTEPRRKAVKKHRIIR